MKTDSRDAGPRRLPSQRGAALLEAVFVFPIFAFLLFGLIDFGMAISLQQSVTHSAAEGARSAIGAQIDPALDENSPSPNQYSPDPQTNAWERVAVDHVMAGMTWIGGNVAYVTVSPSVAACPGGTAGAMCITVAVSYPYGAHPIVPDIPGLGIVNPAMLKSTAVVQVQ